MSAASVQYSFPPKTPFGKASRPLHLLLAVTGSVASVKLPLLLDELASHFTPAQLQIHVLVTPASTHFLPPLDSLYARAPGILERIWTNESDFETWLAMGDPVLHIELRKWADVFLIAPTSANTLASCAHGLCSGIVQNTLRAWDWKETRKGRQRVVMAPAMNTIMWEHPVTDEHIQKVEGWGAKVLEVVGKKLACGDVGLGGMVSVERLVQVVKEERDVVEKAWAQE